MVAISSGECGDSNATYANETWGMVNATNVSGDGVADASYDFGTPLVGLPGESYTLCWGHDVTEGDLATYNVQLDVAGDLAGPNVGELLGCTLGEQCTVDISGHRLKYNDGAPRLRKS